MRWRLVWTALFSCLLSWHVPVSAIDTLHLQAEQWALDNTTAKQFDLSVDLTEQGLQLKASAETLDLPPPFGQLQQLQLRCESLQLHAGQWQCESGAASFNHKRMKSVGKVDVPQEAFLAVLQLSKNS